MNHSVRLGIIGIGNMGKVHAQMVQEGKIHGCELAAVCDVDANKLTAFEGVPHFVDATEMLRSSAVNAVLIATPHYDHTALGVAALEAGLHVLVEKPISVHVADCRKLIAAYEGRQENQVFAAMFNQRTDPFYGKLRQLIQDGELGEIRRVNWIITSWFRTAAYYASGGWRATWSGEGGGVLLNQCPHNLDLMQWLFGMPVKVRATCRFGYYHDIEVEDDVTAFLEYENGATGVFITSTGEAPGTNRLEVTAERGRVVIEEDRFSFIRNEMPMSEFCNTTPGSFATPAVWKVEIPISGHGGQHREILQNFVDAIAKDAELIAPAVEGIHSVELANAMLLSAFVSDEVTLPIDAERYAKELQSRIDTSKFVKKTVAPGATDDFSKSFAQ